MPLMPLHIAHQTIMPPYVRNPAMPPVWRRVSVLLIQLAIAAAYGFGAVVLPPSLLYLLGIPIVLCLLASLWLMPDRGVFSLGLIESIYRVLLVLTVIWPVYLAVVLPGLPWLTPTRMTLFVLTFFFLYSVSTSARLRSHLAIVARSSQLVWIAFLIWQAMLFITLPLSPHPIQSIKAVITDELRLTEMFFLGCLLFAKPGAATRTISWLLILAVICSLDCLLEYRLQYPPWANHIPSFLRVDDATLSVVLGAQSRSSDGLYRARGPFVTSLVFAEFLAICMPFILHWILTGRTLLLRLVMSSVWVLVLTANVLTQSRLGLVGTIVGTVVYVPLWAFRRWRADPTSLAGPTILFGAPIVAVAMIGVVFSSHTLTMRVLGGGAQQASTEAREEQRRLTIPKVLRNPIGYGRTSSGGVIGFVSPSGVVTVDNHYLTTVIDLGIPGLIGFYGMFAVAAWQAGRQFLQGGDNDTDLSGPLAAMFAMFLVVKSVLSEETNHGLVFLLLGMTLALRARHKHLVGMLDFDGEADITRRSSPYLIGKPVNLANRAGVI